MSDKERATEDAKTNKRIEEKSFSIPVPSKDEERPKIEK